MYFLIFDNIKYYLNRFFFNIFFNSYFKRKNTILLTFNLIIKKFNLLILFNFIKLKI